MTDEVTGGKVSGSLPFQPGQKLTPDEAENPVPVDTTAPAAAPEPQEEPTPSRQVVTREQARLCPKCGHDVRQPIDIEPSPEDKRAFIRSIMTSTRFTKTYPLFDGAVRVTFRTQTQSEIEEVVDFLRSNAGTFIDLPTVQVEINKLGMVQSLAAVEIQRETADGGYNKIEYPVVTTNVYKPSESSPDGEIAAVRALQHIFKGTSTPLFQAILRTYLEFTFIVDTMMLRSGQSDFWKATPSQP